jgi:hypothetical protein
VISLIMPIIQPQPFLEFGQWLDANADELARMGGVSQQQEIKAALREIAKATGSDWDVMVHILVTVSATVFSSCSLGIRLAFLRSQKSP